MFGIIGAFFQREALVLLKWGAIALAVLGVLFYVRRDGRNAERVDNLERAAKVKDAQLKSATSRARTDDELDQRLRGGRF